MLTDFVGGMACAVLSRGIPEHAADRLSSYCVSAVIFFDTVMKVALRVRLASTMSTINRYSRVIRRSALFVGTPD